MQPCTHTVSCLSGRRMNYADPVSRDEPIPLTDHTLQHKYNLKCFISSVCVSDLLWRRSIACREAERYYKAFCLRVSLNSRQSCCTWESVWVWITECGSEKTPFHQTVKAKLLWLLWRRRGWMDREREWKKREQSWLGESVPSGPKSNWQECDMTNCCCAHKTLGDMMDGTPAHKQLSTHTHKTVNKSCDNDSVWFEYQAATLPRKTHYQSLEKWEDEETESERANLYIKQHC